jgi:hypothetical protein
MKRILLVVAAGLVVLVIAAWVIGSRLPIAHVATIRVHYGVRPDSVWTVITDFPAQPAWFSEVKRSERVADINGHPTWREDLGGFTADMETAEWEPPRRLVRVVHAQDAGFRGSWTWELAPADSTGTTLTLTERGEVDNPFFRLMVAAMDETATIHSYAQALGRRLGVEAHTEN